MKKRIISFTLILPISIIGFQSYKSGPTSSTGNRTGSNGSNTGCASCHGSKSTSTSVSIELLDGGTAVTSYIPGKTYDVRLSATNTNANPVFGFQLVSGSASPSSSLFGTFDNSGVSGINLKLSNQLVEQSTPNEGTIDAGVSSFSKTIKWTAPASGSGDIKFYSVVNSANNNGDDDSGDDWNFGTSAVISENTGSTNIVEHSNNFHVAIFPNPASEKIQIDLGKVTLDNYDIYVLAADGRSLIHETIAIGQQDKTIVIKSLPAGHYLVNVKSKSADYSTHLIKQ